MPTTPFIGISVIIHTVIIIFSKIFPPKEREIVVEKKFSKLRYAASLLIIVGMTSLMLFTAAGLLIAGVNEQHSTIYLVEDTAQWVGSHADAHELVAQAEAAYGPRVGNMAEIAFFLALLFVIVPRIKFDRMRMSLPSGGHSMVQVSLLISGLLSLLVGATYLVLIVVVIASRAS